MEEAKTLKTTSAKAEQAGKSKSSKSLLDFIIVGSIAAVFFLCPLFFTGNAAQGMGFEKVILFYFLVLLGVVGWVTKGAIKGELNLKRTPLDLPIFAILIIFIISTVLSISSRDSLIGAYGNSSKSLLAVIIFIIFYYLVINNLNAKRIKIIFWSLISSCFFMATFCFSQLREIFWLDDPFTHAQSFNPLGSLSGLTMYLVIMLPFLIIATAQTREILPNLNKIFIIIIKIISGATLLISLAILAMLNGFTFWPVAIVGIVIVLMFFMSKIIKISNNNLLIPLFVFLALIILLVLGNFDIASLKLPSEVSLSRNASWEIAKSSLRENPVLGSGPSTFYYDFTKYKSINFNSSPLWNVRFDSSTGNFFEFLATVGILGTLAIGFLIIIVFSISFAALIKVNEKGVSSILLALFAGLVSIVLFSVLFSQNNALILFSTVISIFAVTSFLVMYPEKYKTLKLSFRASARYALALAAIFLCVSAGVVVLFTMGVKMYLGDVNAKEAIASTDTNAKIQKLNRAITLAPYQDNYYLSLANSYMALANQGMVSGASQASIGENLSLAIRQGQKAVEISGNKAVNNESLALVYENASFYTRGALDWAEDHYRKVMELDPHNPVPYLRTALINMARSNTESDTTEKEFYIGEAIKYYDLAISKKGDLASAYYGKAVASEKLNKIDEAIEELLRASLISSNNIDYRFELGRLYFNRGVAQLNLEQSNTKRITESEFTVEEEDGEESEELSVKPTQPTGNVVKRNNDLNLAERAFASIVQANPNHANAIYSLAVLYRKIDELDKAKILVNRLLEILDENTKAVIMQQFGDIL